MTLTNWPMISCDPKRVLSCRNLVSSCLVIHVNGKLHRTFVIIEFALSRSTGNSQTCESVTTCSPSVPAALFIQSIGLTDVDSIAANLVTEHPPLRQLVHLQTNYSCSLSCLFLQNRSRWHPSYRSHPYLAFLNFGLYFA
jgi:hypothetical protein